MNSQNHLPVLIEVINKLGDFKDSIVFVGGSIISVYINESESVAIRETFDVDCIVEANSRLEYEKFAQKLRELGFSESSQENVICRFKNKDLIIDMMPTNQAIFGFGNPWYKEGIKSPKEIKIGKNVLKVLSLPYLIATKLDAFRDRGKSNFRTSHDLEDIVTLIDGNSYFSVEIKSTDEDLNKFLGDTFTSILNDKNFIESIEGHISDRGNLSSRMQIILSRVKDAIKVLKKK